MKKILVSIAIPVYGMIETTSVIYEVGISNRIVPTKHDSNSSV